MRVYWLRDRENQKHFRTYWKKEIENNADYLTKHHPTSHHKDMRGKYVLDKLNHVRQILSSPKIKENMTTKKQTACLQGCVDPKIK